MYFAVITQTAFSLSRFAHARICRCPSLRRSSVILATTPARRLARWPSKLTSLPSAAASPTSSNETKHKWWADATWSWTNFKVCVNHTRTHCHSVTSMGIFRRPTWPFLFFDIDNSWLRLRAHQVHKIFENCWKLCNCLTTHRLPPFPLTKKELYNSTAIGKLRHNIIMLKSERSVSKRRSSWRSGSQQCGIECRRLLSFCRSLVKSSFLPSSQAGGYILFFIFMVKL